MDVETCVTSLYLFVPKIISINIFTEDVRSNSNETHKVTSSVYISYNLLLEGSEHELISISHV